MRKKPFLKSQLALAGIAAGLAGLLAFLSLHHALIRPIWGVAPLGVPVAALGGLAVAWAFEPLRPRLPANGWLAAFAFVGLLLLTQAASFAVSAAIGWLLGRGPRRAQATGRMALAALAFALGPGHNTAFFAGVPAAAGTLWLPMLGTVLAATVAFGAVVTN